MEASREKQLPQADFRQKQLEGKQPFIYIAPKLLWYSQDSGWK